MNTAAKPWDVGASPSRRIALDSDLPFHLERYDDGGGGGARLLIVPPIINHPWILDLRPEVSVVRRFCEKGFDVHEIRWHVEGNAELGFHDMVTFIREVSERIGTASVFGYCTGGIIALLFAALNPGRLESLALLATPVDFSGHDPRVVWGRHFDVLALRRFFRNVPGSLVNSIGAALFYQFLPSFLLRPEYREELSEPEALEDHWRRLRWITDTPAIPGKAYQEFILGCYRDNALIGSEMRIDGRRVDLGKVTAPVLNIMAEFDHVVPLGSVQALRTAVSSRRYDEIVFPSTHVGLSVSGRAHRDLWPGVAEWIEARQRSQLATGSAQQ